MQSSSFPKGVCFHTHSAVIKRRDEVVAPSMLVRRTDSTERKVRNLHSLILFSTCSHINLNTFFLLSSTVAPPVLGVDVAMCSLGCKAIVPKINELVGDTETSYMSGYSCFPLPFSRLSYLDIIATLLWKHRTEYT